MSRYTSIMSKTLLTLFAMGMSLISSEAIAVPFPSAPYFPLPVSASWTYDVDSGAGITTVTRNITPLTINGVSTIRLDTSSTILAPVNGSMSYNTSDGSGIRLHRKYLPNLLIDGTARNVTITFNPPVVLADGMTDVGDTANVTSGIATLVIPGAGLFGGDVTCFLPYTEPLVFTVNGFESVDVPAGHFDNVLNISGSIRITGTCLVSPVDLTLAFTLYLAQNIGPVKTVSTVTDNIAGTTNTSTSVLTGTNLPAFTLSVTKPGAGSGTVTSSPIGISCGADCSESYASGTPVTLTASPTGGSTFDGWAGDCAGTAVTCALTMDGAKAVSATFTPPPHTLAITGGPGGSPNPVASGGAVNLSVTANDSLGHTLFYAWSVTSCTGGLGSGSSISASRTPTWTAPANTTGSQQSCTIQVTVNDGAVPDPKSVSQSFTETVNFLVHTVTITSGPGGSPNPVASGGAVTLSVTATDSFGDGLTYAWSVISCTGGLDSGSLSNAALQNPAWTAPANTTGSQQSCTISVQVSDGILPSVPGSYSQAVNAVPPPPPSSYNLNVTAAGSGTGSITSSVGGINCGVGNGGTCSTTIANGAGVTLTATPTGGSTFGGWGVDCAASGTASTCFLTMNAAKTVSATFTAPPPPGSFNLNVTALGGGTGDVTSSPGGIACEVGNSGTCAASLTSGTGVTLTAAATGGATFAGWGDDCTSFGTDAACNLTMDSAKTASAMFTPAVATGRQLMDVMTRSGPEGPEQRAFLTTDPIAAEATYYDPADACVGSAPTTLKFFVFNLEGQLVLGKNRDTTGGVTNTQVGTSKYQALIANLDAGELPAGSYNLVFRVEDCVPSAIIVSGFYSIRVLAP